MKARSLFACLTLAVVCVCARLVSAQPIPQLRNDLGGTAPAPEVVGILDHALPSLSLGYMYWNGSAWVFQTPAGFSVSGTGFPIVIGGTLQTAAYTLSGQVTSGTPSGGNVPTTFAQNGAATGNTYYWNGSAWTPGALNLAGGSSTFTGLLPAANQAAQTMGGDVTGTTAANTVTQATGAALIPFISSSTEYAAVGKWTAGAAGSVYLGSGISPGTSNFTLWSDGTNTALNAPASGGYVSIRGAANNSTGEIQVGPNPGATTYGAIWLGNITPSGTNTTLEGDGATATIMRTPGSSGYLGFYNGSSAGVTIDSSGNVTATQLAGTGTRIVDTSSTGLLGPVSAGTTGQALLQGSSTVAFGALNLAGGSSTFTGLLPAANQAAQTMGGDVTGTTAANTVTQATGAALIPFISSSTEYAAVGKWTAGAAGSVYLGSGISPGTSNFTLWSDGTNTALNAPASGGYVSIRGAANNSTGEIQVGPNPGATTYGAIWLGNITPSGTNTTLEGDGATATIMRTPGSSGYLGFYNGSSAGVTIDSSGNVTATQLAGTGTRIVDTSSTGLLGPVSAGTTGQALLQGSSTVAFGALNLAGGSSIVTGLLPGGNLGTITLTGDVTGSASGGSIATTVAAISGTTPILITPNELRWTAATIAPELSQAAASSGAGADILVKPQAATTTGASGNLTINVSAPASGTTEAGIKLERAGTFLALMSRDPSFSSFTDLWMGDALSPGANNYALSSSGSITALNSTGDTILGVNGTTIAMATSAGFTVPANTQLGSNTTSFGGGSTVVGITNATVAPSTAPTGGGVLSENGGQLNHYGSGGAQYAVSPTGIGTIDHQTAFYEHEMVFVKTTSSGFTAGGFNFTPNNSTDTAVKILWTAKDLTTFTTSSGEWWCDNYKNASGSLIQNQNSVYSYGFGQIECTINSGSIGISVDPTSQGTDTVDWQLDVQMNVN